MTNYQCVVCGHVHNDAEEGAWDLLPDDYQCPDCGALKEDYVPLDSQS